jgi:N-acetylglucosaminylphosphatidylinositol deacetylase
VIAHPDDEAMFFVPSILQLGAYNSIHVLCLSNGNYAGLGAIREKELVKSCEVL